MLKKLARWCFTHSLRVVLGWAVVIAVLVASLGVVSSAYDNGFDVGESDSASGFELLDQSFPGLSSIMSGTIVFEAETGVTDPTVQRGMSELFDRISAANGEGEAFENVTVLSPYDPSGSTQIVTQGPKAGLVAYAQVVLPGDTDQREAQAMGGKIVALSEELGLDEIEGLNIEIGGAQLAEFDAPESEFVGVAFAIGVLILVMGSVIAMGATIGVAVVGVATGAMVIGLVSNLISMPDFASSIGIMIGLGVGIDYALFIVTRYREALAEGRSPLAAVERAMDTAGRSVIFAGLTVIVSLLGMLLIGLSFVTGLGVAAALTVAVVMVGSITLLPAILGLVTDRVNTTRVGGLVAAALVAVGLLGAGLGVRALLGAVPLAVVVALVTRAPFAGWLGRKLPPRAPKPVRGSIWYRWSRLVQSRPWLWVGVSVGVLLTLAAPLMSLQLGFSDEGTYQEDTTTRRAYDLLAEGFGEGVNGQMIVATEIATPADMEALGALSEALASTEGIVFASPPFPDDPNAPTAAIIGVQPTTSPPRPSDLRSGCYPA